MLVESNVIQRNMSEEESLIIDAQKGDSDAFSTLVELYSRPVFNLCYRMLGNSGDAEDAAQETFMRAYRAIRRYDNNRKFSTWVLSIASHYCIDQMRKKRLNTFSMDAMPYVSISDNDPGPEKRLIMEQRHVRVQELLTKLKPRDKAAVVMRYWYGLSYEEIAEALGLTNSAVKSRLHRARKIMANTWKADEKQQAYEKETVYGTETA